MDKKELARHKSLLPNGIPKNIRLYDNGGVDNGGTLDCYTCVFTGNYPGRDGYCFYVSFNGCPNHPQMGIYMRSMELRIIDYPRYSHIGKKISFQDLNPECQQAILEEYRSVWKLDPTYKAE